MLVAAPHQQKKSALQQGSEKRKASSYSEDPSGAPSFFKKSNLYQEFLAEREEILRYKWLESERRGYDIGFEKALLEWIRKHREKWRMQRRKQRLTEQKKRSSK